MRFYSLFSLVACTLLSLNIDAQNFDESNYDALEYRLVGPFRGGRSAAVTGVPNQPNLYYFGATGGGIWKTMDGGRTWEIFLTGFLVEVLGLYQYLKATLM